ncbi:MAG: UDP-glucose 4-epimerase, partial [Pantoea agglomerans]
PAFWADASLANTTLDWRVTRGIDEMMRDTWNWQSKNPDGFR